MRNWKRTVSQVVTGIVNALIPAPAQLLRKAGGVNYALVIRAALELGIFEWIPEGGASADQLAKALVVDASALRRLLRALVAAGLLVEQRPGHYQATAQGVVLRSEASGSVTALARYIVSDALVLPLMALSHSVRTGQPSFQRMMGTSWYDYGDQHPEHLAIMDSAMNVYSRIGLPALLGSYPFSRFKLIVDIAGGMGHLLAGVLHAAPVARGILFDQPATIARAARYLDAQQLSDRCQLVGGNMFEQVPAGGDLYLLSKTLNDWDDAHAARILRSIRTAMPEDGRLIVLEMVAKEGEASVEETMRDLMLLVCTTGRTRTEDEFRALLQGAGFSLSRVIPTVAPYRLAGLIGITSGFAILEALPTAWSRGGPDTIPTAGAIA